MFRAHKDVDWSPYLAPADLPYVTARVDPNEWCPMETFERLGVGILHEIARGDLQLVKHFGRVSLDALCNVYDNLVAAGDPNESLLRFRVLRQSFFDFPALEIEDVFEHSAAATVNYGMGPVAEEAATWQTMGFFERLLERCGGSPLRVSLTARSWAGDPRTRIQMEWTRPKRG